MQEPPQDRSAEETAQRLALALSASNLGDWTWDRASDAMTLSDRACEIFGMPKASRCTRESMRSMLNEEDQERARQANATALALGTGYEIEYLIHRADGTTCWVATRGQCLLDAGGEVTGMVGVVQDITERVETSRELRDTRERLESTLIAAEIGTWTWDVPTDEVLADANLATMFFLDPARTRGRLRDFLRFIHPEDRRRVEDVIGGAMTGGAFEMDYRLRRSDGSIRWVNARGRVELDAAGRPRRVPGVIIDITERKRQEEAALAARHLLDEKTRIYDTALSVTDDFAYFFDREGRFTFANRRLLEVWGKTLPEIIGKTCLELGYPDWHAAMHWREIQQVIATRQPIKGEVPYTAPTGIFGIYEYIFKPVFSAEGEVESIAGTTRDVTDRKRAEAVVARQHQVLQLLAEERPLNDILTTLVRLVEEQAEGGMRGSIMLLTEDGRRLVHGAAPSLPPGYSEAISGGEIGPAVGSCGSAAWARKPVYVSNIATDPLWEGYREVALSFGLHACWSCPIMSGEDKLLGTFAMYYAEPREPQDADRRIMETATRTAAVAIERRQAEEVLRKSRDEAEAANRAKDRFLAVLSHELRTPLTPVLMTVAARQLDPSLSSDLQADMAMIRRNLDLEITLIDDMLDLSRIMSGKLRLRLETLAVNSLVAEACAICRPQILEKAIRLECDLDENVRPIQADTARFHQVLWNVLKNAAKFTPEGGQIRVRTVALDDEVEIRVEDSGIGIPPEELSKIFDAFEQGASKAGGLGLGLAISKALMDLHGGTIRAESGGAGTGSAFVLRVPMVHAAPDGGRPDAARASKVSGAPRLLVVEDHADTAIVLCRLLEASGYHVRHAESLAAARQLAATETFDLLISDVGLPDGTGYELMAELRALGWKGIAMSGYGMDEDIRRGREAGFSDHLVKPVDLSILQRTIERLLNSTPAGR